MEDERVAPGDDGAGDRTQCQAPAGDEKVGIGREDPEVDEIHDVDKVAQATGLQQGIVRVQRSRHELLAPTKLTRTKSSGMLYACSPTRELADRTAIEWCTPAESIPASERRRGK